MTTRRVDHVPHLRIELAYETACRHAELVGRIALETGNALPTITTTKLPGDPAALRGIPALVKGGLGGAIPGTRPGSNLDHLDRVGRHHRGRSNQIRYGAHPGLR